MKTLVNDSEIALARKYLLENNAEQFLSMFFEGYFFEPEASLYALTDLNYEVCLYININDWVDSLIYQIESFDVEEWVYDAMKDPEYEEAHSITQSINDFATFKEWLKEIKHFIETNLPSGKEESVKSKGTFVVTFPKTSYTLDMLEGKSDIEKYQAALDGGNECKVYTNEEYCNILNQHLPLDKYVLTFIVNV